MKLTTALSVGVLSTFVWSAPALAETSVVDLISPSRCTLSGGRLTRCAIPTQTLNATPFTSAVPLRTTVRRVLTGNCSTQYPLEVTLTPPGNAGTRYTFLGTPELVLRDLDRELIASLELKDSSPWTNAAAFNETCRVSLNITWNEVDVDSAAQAQSILQGLQSTLATKVAQREHLASLVEYSAAFDYMKTLSNSFLVDLNNETAHALHAQALEAGPVIFQAAMGCGGVLTPEESITLTNFYFVLGSLGDPTKYHHPDGSPKTLEELIGPAALPVIQKLSQLSAAGAKEQYQAQYLVAAQEAAAAQAQVDLATAQLAPWLNP
ncbi:hypothetical protein OWM54_24350 [Myxococcus sp. MISCRS1]|uniref:hypothetical protein n=1 Tax=Myxococcus TaxID=32 RepID=UPI001CBA7705|nr:MULTISPECIES: hypothetical protein [unclassified Myxococcus]MBZ4398600.1 hypothetical protein [Myxococcus sp. AS-1-15]MCY1000276.1 hypothetical protein [Myxococcus sp. MISCRS1]